MSLHSHRAGAALRALTEADPALAALALWCRHRDDDSLAIPAITKGQTIRYGPAFAALALHEQIGLAGHHVLHAALDHSARMADMGLRQGNRFDPELWQIASDAIVNETILAAGHALPRPALTLTALLATTGLQAEQGDALAQWDCERLYHRLLHLPQGAGKARRHAAEQGLVPDLQPEAATRTNAGQTADSAERHAQLARAMAAGRSAGFGLGMLGHRLADLPRPRTPWEIILRRLLTRATTPRPEATPFRPARRWLAQLGHAVQHGSNRLPPWQAGQRLHGQTARIVIALDCSGSIPPAALRLLMAEVAGIARRMQAALHLLVFDEALRIDCALDPASALTTLRGLDLPQGGGTDFAPVLARAATLSPSALVILTDMDGPVGHATPPRFPVIWATLQADPPAPAFGRALSLAR